MAIVAIQKCSTYEKEVLKEKIRNCLDAIGSAEFLKPGMKVFLKPNCVGAFPPNLGNHDASRFSGSGGRDFEGIHG